MIRPFIICIIFLLAGCAQSNSWYVEPTLTEPTEEQCSQVFFGESVCVLNEKEKASSSSASHKAPAQKLMQKLEGQLDIVSYVGVNVGMRW